jgi:ArsR family transcriptional regulator
MRNLVSFFAPAVVFLLAVAPRAQSEAPVCACDLPAFLGLSQPTVSHHLAKLTRSGLLRREQRGKWAYFSLDPDAAERLTGIVRFQEVSR